MAWGPEPKSKNKFVSLTSASISEAPFVKFIIFRWNIFRWWWGWRECLHSTRSIRAPVARAPQVTEQILKAFDHAQPELPVPSPKNGTAKVIPTTDNFPRHEIRYGPRPLPECVAHGACRGPRVRSALRRGHGPPVQTPSVTPAHVCRVASRARATRGADVLWARRSACVCPVSV